MDCSSGPCAINLALDRFVILVRRIIDDFEPWKRELNYLAAGISSSNLLLEYLKFVFHLWVNIALGVWDDSSWEGVADLIAIFGVLYLGLWCWVLIAWASVRSPWLSLLTRSLLSLMFILTYPSILIRWLGRIQLVPLARRWVRQWLLASPFRWFTIWNIALHQILLSLVLWRTFDSDFLDELLMLSLGRALVKTRLIDASLLHRLGWSMTHRYSRHQIRSPIKCIVDVLHLEAMHAAYSHDAMEARSVWKVIRT